MTSKNAERVKRWRNTNRALWNLRRKQYRRQGKPESVEKTPQRTDEPKRKIAELRELVEKVVAEPVEAVVKPLIYRDDYGRILTERQWNALQKLKDDARKGGYERDEYSQ